MDATRILTLVGLTLATLTVGSAASAGGGGFGACPAFAPDGDAGVIELRDSCLAPVSATAEAGSTVTVTNVGDLPHSYTALDGSFDSGVIEPGESATIELPETPATMPVHCTLHADRSGNGMAGTITLSAASAGPVSAATSGGLLSSGLALAGGFVLGSGTLAALRRRRERKVLSEVGS